MSLAEQLKEEGRVEGEIKGEFKKSVEIAQRMLDAGSDPFFVEKVTGLSLEHIKELKNQIN